ncbi:hypothetical protein [Methanosarcina vacuolata]|uniref:Uncharacterized protein n=1 Tax=Methanosarcina vacuolata Z-761 TaxID=1434123 RepID=A0A0E3Q936_9EURY|nr:hypothetical protein [Methanosarcina vacuolata]AKB45273.1 hypothetical protein MSVAZ_3004 [Methanosarcina vacuolata Z-761]
MLDRVELVRNEKELTSGRVSQIRFKNVIASDSDVRIKQTIDEEKNKLIKFIKTTLEEVDENDFNYLWEGYVKILNYFMNFLFLIDQIVMYKDTYWKYIIPIFEEVHSLNVTQNRYKKEGMINYLHFSLLEIVGALLLARKSFKCLNTLLKIKKLNLKRDGTENLLDWNIQAKFIEEKNEREANINQKRGLVVPRMGYFLKLIDTFETPFEFNIIPKVLDVDLLYYVYSLANPLGKYFDFWYPQSIVYLRYGCSDTFKQIKYDEEFGNKIAEELFETDYNGLIAQLVNAKDHFEQNLSRGYGHFPFENPFKDF